MQITRYLATGILLFAYGCLAFGFQARVVGMADGDTVTVIDDSNQRKRAALPRSLTKSSGVEVPRAAAAANRSGC